MYRRRGGPEKTPGSGRDPKSIPKDHLDEIVVLIPDLEQTSDTNPASWAIFGRDGDTNPGFGTK